jgi:hypothetical protein
MMVHNWKMHYTIVENKLTKELGRVVGCGATHKGNEQIVWYSVKFADHNETIYQLEMDEKYNWHYS